VFSFKNVHLLKAKKQPRFSKPFTKVHSFQHVQRKPKNIKKIRASFVEAIGFRKEKIKMFPPCFGKRQSFLCGILVAEPAPGGGANRH
jgi:hypothetical protein